MEKKIIRIGYVYIKHITKTFLKEKRKLKQNFHEGKANQI